MKGKTFSKSHIRKSRTLLHIKYQLNERLRAKFILAIKRFAKKSIEIIDY